MKRKIVWLVASCLMALSLLMASCAPAITEEEEVAPPEKEKEVVTEEEVAPPPGEPQYGGVLNCALSMPVVGFDPGYVIAPLLTPIQITHDDLLTGDWSKGPAGTGEVSWKLFSIVPSAEIPCLAESWEMPDEETIVFHIRQGVHFHDKPPVNGREMTADDVVFTIKRRYFSDLPMAAEARGVPEESIQSVEATDRYTVVVKCPPLFIWRHLVELAAVMEILPPEAGGEFPGDFSSVESCIGTGPFMLVDYVPASSLTYVRNPNYWRSDPLHPDNILPYVDGVNMLVIPDASTRLAALRTGKIDTLRHLSWEDKESLLKTNPELEWDEELNEGQSMVGMRLDNPELPWHDIRVRRALSMAIDRQAIARDYYGGNAEIFWWPILPIKEFKDMFIPLEEYSEAIQEQYEYKPEKARQLLAEAGYPNGFKTEIVCTAPQVDLLSVIKAMWADIGVDLKIDVKERGTYEGLFRTRRHKQMMFGSGALPDPQKLRQFRIGVHHNSSIISDPYIEDIYKNRLVKDVWDWDKLCQVMKEVNPYILEQCWYIQPPTPYVCTFWQPWLKGYHGEWSVGHLNGESWPIYVWLDQQLKKEMGH